jgi:hypothetical protein
MPDKRNTDVIRMLRAPLGIGTRTLIASVFIDTFDVAGTLVFKQLPASGQDSTTVGKRWTCLKISFW